MKDKIERLFDLASQAKELEVGHYALPNAVFCLLLEAMFSSVEGAEDIRVVYEDSGIEPEQVYYDLVTLELPAGEGYRPRQLTIPVPLLKGETTVTLLKRRGTEVIGKADRPRVQKRPPQEDEYFELWQEVEDLLANQEGSLIVAVNRHLKAEEVEKNLFASSSSDELGTWHLHRPLFKRV